MTGRDRVPAICHARLMHCMMTLACVLSSFGLVYAQGFMAKPMKVDAQAAPGATAEMAIEITNTLPHAQQIEIIPTRLTQHPEGSWMQLPEGQPEGEVRSCLSWLSFAETSLALPAAGGVETTLEIAVPRGTRGTYSAAFLVRAQRPASENGIGVIIQFLIPVHVHVQGSAARERVEVADVSLVKASEDEGVKDDRIITTIRNSGETYVTVGGQVRLQHREGDVWRTVGTFDVRPRGIIPGIELGVPTDLKRLLPPGQYRLDATTTGNGRRLGAVAREVDFEGHPGAVIASDQQLEHPAVVQLDGVPGGTRSGSVTISNPGAEMLNITPAVVMHPALRAAGNKQTMGADLSASDWITVMPDAFPLRAGSERALRLMVRIPEVEAPRANYYALLDIAASYADDDRAAGHSDALLWVRNTELEPTYAADAIALRLSEDSPSKYSVTATFSNSGDTHWTGSCHASLRTASSAERASIPLETTSDTVLPLGSATYSGVMDFSEVEPGTYVLHLVLNYSGHEHVERLPVIITADEAGTRVIEQIENGAVQGEAGGAQ